MLKTLLCFLLMFQSVNQVSLAQEVNANSTDACHFSYDGLKHVESEGAFKSMLESLHFNKMTGSVLFEKKEGDVQTVVQFLKPSSFTVNKSMPGNFNMWKNSPLEPELQGLIDGYCEYAKTTWRGSCKVKDDLVQIAMNQLKQGVDGTGNVTNNDVLCHVTVSFKRVGRKGGYQYSIFIK
jgi:hypothetical protein